MASYPCPNPACAHTFRSDEIQSAAALTCPKCGNVFRFRTVKTAQGAPASAAKTTSTAARPAAPPATPPPASIPLAKPVAAATPPPADNLFDLGGEAASVVRRMAPNSASRKKRTLHLILSVGIGMIVVVGGVFAVKALLPSGEPEETGKGQIVIGKLRNLKGADERVFKLTLSPGAWEQDSDLKGKLGAVTAWRSTDKDAPAWFAVVVHDYGFAKPRDAELLRTGIAKLERLFDGAVELAEKPQPVQLAGTTGQRLIFKGNLGTSTCWGQLCTFDHQGIGYWLIAAAPGQEETEDLVTKQFGSGIFSITTTRDGWREQTARTDSFHTDDGGLTIAAPEGLFTKHPALNHDERGQLYLFGKYQKDQDNRKNSDVLVLVLDAQADLKEAATAAKKYLEERKRDESKEYKLEAVADGENAEAIAQDVGDRPGLVSEWRVMLGESPTRFWVVAVVGADDTTYVIRCECAWEHRHIWRGEFHDLLRNARIRERVKKESAQ